MARLSVGDLVKCKNSFWYGRTRITPRDVGLLLELEMRNGLSLCKIHWQQKQVYTEKLPTYNIERVEGNK